MDVDGRLRMQIKIDGIKSQALGLGYLYVLYETTILTYDDPDTDLRNHDIMQTISASDAKQAFASMIETAAREPVIIQRQKRDVAVVMSMAEYERLTRLNVGEFQRFCDRIGNRAAQAGLDEAALDELLTDD